MIMREYSDIWSLTFCVMSVLFCLIFQTLLAGLESKDWVLVCEALNNVRRISIFHKDAMLDIL